jgi:hypothetical protein
MSMSDDDRGRDLIDYANAGSQENQPAPPRGHALVRPTTGVGDRVIGAQVVAVHRDESKVLKKLASLAAAAGTDWFYRFPVRKKVRDETTGKDTWAKDWIEGPSIKLANDVARIFGNDAIEVRELDVGDAFVFYARFTDLETGFSMERAYRQRKSQGSLRGDADRQLDIAYQIGQSKAIRNVIVNSLQIYADYAFEEARNSLVDKIGKDVDAWRKRTLQGLSKIPVDVARVERVVGRAAKDWLAPDIGQVIAMMKAIADGMATVDETFPSLDTQAAEQSEASGETSDATSQAASASVPAGRAPDSSAQSREPKE